MRQNNYFEIIVGTFVLLCASLFLFNSFNSAKIKTNFNLNLKAQFDDIGGIDAGSDVKISGIKIGVVKDRSIDPKNYRAVLNFGIIDNIKIPTDSSAKIVSAGLLGEKYLEIVPGADEEFLKEGEEIIYTQSSINFEQLLGKFMFSDKKDKDHDKK